MHLVNKYTCRGCTTTNILNPAKGINEIVICKKCRYKQKISINDYAALVNNPLAKETEVAEKIMEQPKEIEKKASLFFELHHLSHPTYLEHPVKYVLKNGITTVGRIGKNADIQIEDESQTMGRLHFKIEINLFETELNATIEDLNSVNGTFIVVNDTETRLESNLKYPLQNDLIAKAGHQLFKIKLLNNEN